MFNLFRNIKVKTNAIFIGDWGIIIASLALVFVLFQQLWTHENAARVQIRLGNTVYGTYSLNQQREVLIKGPIGTTTISIMSGKARFSKSPCRNQYCVHQGWLSHAGQAALCLPNHLSLELISEEKHYDSLNY